MQKKQTRLYCILFAIWLLTSCICFDGFPSDHMMFSSDVVSSSTSLITSNDSTANEDICTIQMLGISHTNLLYQRTYKRTNDTNHKWDFPFLLQMDVAPSQSAVCFLSVTDSKLLSNKAYLTNVIHYIHDMDGKKKH